MKIGHVTARLAGPHGYPVDVTAGAHAVHADEPGARGGTDTGPTPFALLLSGLAACTLITLRMYAERKQWPLDGAQVTVDMTEDDGTQRIERVLRLDGPLDGVQRARLVEIAERTPVTRTLKRALEIHTRLAAD